jgi:hypothetical protein
MSRIYVTLAAAAASALAAAAIVALPAIGDEPGGGVDSDADIAELVSCLRAQGLDAPSAFEEFKPWMARQAARDPEATRAAERACEEHLPQVSKPVTSIPDEFIECVRAHGLDAPTEPAAFDRWMRRLEATNPDAVKEILPECKRAVEPEAKPGDCGSRPKPPAREPST